MKTGQNLKVVAPSAVVALLDLGLVLPGAAAEGRGNPCTQSNPPVIGQWYVVRGIASPSADVAMVLGI